MNEKKEDRKVRQCVESGGKIYGVWYRDRLECSGALFSSSFECEYIANRLGGNKRDYRCMAEWARRRYQVE